MHTLKVTQIGKSYEVILPKDGLSRLKLSQGDTFRALAK